MVFLWLFISCFLDELLGEVFISFFSLLIGLIGIENIAVFTSRRDEWHMFNKCLSCALVWAWPVYVCKWWGEQKQEIGKAVYKGGERKGEEFVALFYNSFIRPF